MISVEIWRGLAFPIVAVGITGRVLAEKFADRAMPLRRILASGWRRGAHSRKHMERHVLSLLCDPDTRYPLELAGNNLRNTATGRIYPIRDGIPMFVSTVKGPNLKYQTMYDYIAPGYDLAERLYHWVARKPNYRQEYLSELEIKPGDRVLEVSVGTGANLRFLSEKIDFYGLDLSWGMLRKCQRNLKHWNRNAHLFHGEAERLPFKVEAFDCVFHVGGINFFTDKIRAIKEMIWVAKSGTKIVIVDETAKTVKENYQRTPVVRNNFEPGSENVRCPIDLIPEEMKDVSAREICDGKLYCLTFRKP
jgi:ubiquinone/menaquinone biosynthesis C-methylase UbiE